MLEPEPELEPPFFTAPAAKGRLRLYNRVREKNPVGENIIDKEGVLCLPLSGPTALEMKLF